MHDLLATCHVVACPQCQAYHPAIIQQLYALKDSDQARKSHYFAGRYENIYLAPQAVPEIVVILDNAVKQAASILACKPSELQLRFWFNLMQQEDVTLPHTHDVNDEVLSATYYLQAPPQSGKLLLRFMDSIREIEPSEGTFVFFAPEIEHEVTIHQHATARISLGLNFGYTQPG